MTNRTAFHFWQSSHKAPYHFPMDEALWNTSMHEDVDTDTARDNLAAQGYYEKNGFTNEGITRSYYR